MAYPSTFLDIQQMVINNLRLNTTNDTSKVKDAINQAYAQTCIETDANVVSSTEMTLAAGTTTYVLPTDVFRIKTLFVTPANGLASRPLKRKTLDQILAMRSAGGNTGGPIWAYSLLGLNDFEVYPTPTGPDVVTLYFTTLPTKLAGDGDLPILQEPYATDCLKYGAMAKLSEFSGDPDGPYYLQLFMQTLASFRAHLSRREGRITGQFNIQDDTIWRPHDPSTDDGGW